MILAKQRVRHEYNVSRSMRHTKESGTAKVESIEEKRSASNLYVGPSVGLEETGVSAMSARDSGR